MTTTTTTTTTQTHRLIDTLAATAQGADLLTTLVAGKATTTNAQLNLQTSSSNNSNSAIGQFPSGGDVASICMLPQLFAAWEKKESDNSAAMTNIKRVLTGTAEFGSDNFKPLFPISQSNGNLNYGSFGCPPIPVTTVQHLLSSTVIDSDSDSFLRNENFKRLRDVRRVVADYIKLKDEDELFLGFNLAETMNIIVSSFLFNPLFLKAQWAQREKRLRESAGTAAAPTTTTTTTTTTTQQPVFKIAIWSSQYPMVGEVIDFHHNRLRAMETCFDNAKLPYKIEVLKMKLTRELIESLATVPATSDGRNMPGMLSPSSSCAFIDYAVNFVLENNCTAFLIDHVCFCPGGIIFPVEELARRIKSVAPETLVIIDGAHSIGSVPLDFSNNSSQSPELCFDIFTSNFHKWLAAPKSSAFLYVRKDLHRFVHSPIVSNFHRGEDPALLPNARGGAHVRRDIDTTPTEQLHTEMVWRGTLDFTNCLILPECIYFRKRVSSPDASSDERWIKHNRALVISGAKEMARVFGTEVLLADAAPHMIASMACVRLPSNLEKPLVFEAVNRSLARYGSFLAVNELDGVLWVRIGAQVYHSLSDFTAAATRFLEIVEEIKEEKK